MNNIKARLIVMNFLQFAIWGAYLTCIGQFLGKAGLGDYVLWFYIAQGAVSIFMPAVMGALADRGSTLSVRDKMTDPPTRIHNMMGQTALVEKYAPYYTL